MKYHDLRDFIAQLESIGELKRIRAEIDIRNGTLIRELDSTVATDAATNTAPTPTPMPSRLCDRA